MTVSYHCNQRTPLVLLIPYEWKFRWNSWRWLPPEPPSGQFEPEEAEVNLLSTQFICCVTCVLLAWRGIWGWHTEQITEQTQTQRTLLHISYCTYHWTNSNAAYLTVHITEQTQTQRTLLYKSLNKLKRSVPYCTYHCTNSNGAYLGLPLHSRHRYAEEKDNGEGANDADVVDFISHEGINTLANKTTHLFVEQKCNALPVHFIHSPTYCHREYAACYCELLILQYLLLLVWTRVTYIRNNSY